jgi:hypothetical protein
MSKLSLGLKGERRLASQSEFDFAIAVLTELGRHVLVESLIETRKIYPDCIGQPVVVNDLLMAKDVDQVVMLPPGTYDVPRQIFDESSRIIIGMPTGKKPLVKYPILRFDDGLATEEINLDTYQTTVLEKYRVHTNCFACVRMQAKSPTIIEVLISPEESFTDCLIRVECSQNIEVVAFSSIRRLREGRDWALNAYGPTASRKLDWFEKNLDRLYEAGLNVIDTAFNPIISATAVVERTTEEVYRHIGSPIKGFVDKVFRDQVQPVPGSILHCSLKGAEHTGVYVGDGQIVELLGSGLVRRGRPSNFIEGTNAVTIYVACHDTKPLGSAEIAERAKSQVGNFRDYKLFFDNCHQFTCGCITSQFENSNNFFYMVESVIREQMNFGREFTWRAWELDSDELFHPKSMDLTDPAKSPSPISNAIQIQAPKLSDGDGDDEVQIRLWMVSIGDKVEKGEPIALAVCRDESIEVVAPLSGYVLSLIDEFAVPPGSTIAELQRISE